MSSNVPTVETSLWFYADASNQPIGPLPLDELQRLAAAGMIRPESLVIENGGSEWRSFVSICPAQPPPLSTRQRSSRKVLVCVVAIALLVLSLLGGVVSVMEKQAKANPPQRASQNTSERAAQSSKDDFILLKGGTIYSDEETLNEMERASERGGDAGTDALKRLLAAGKIWKAEANTLVSVVRDHGPLGAVFVKAKNPNGKKSAQFWTLGTSLIPMTDARAKDIIRNARSRSEFKWVFDGINGDIVGDAGVENLAGLLQGLSEGHVSLKQAAQAAFEPEAVSAELKQRAGDFLIFDVVSNQGRVLQFAVRRTAENEDGDLFGAAVIVGMESFTTKGGFVRQIPLVTCVRFVE